MCLSGTTSHGHGAHDHGSQDHASGAAGTGSAAHVAAGLSRRNFLKAGAAAGAAGAIVAFGPAARARAAAPGVVDLTHRLVNDFPNFFGDDAGATQEVLFDYATDGFYSLKWIVDEHTGTHMDAPGHFGQGAMLVDEIPASHLVAPLAVIDIKAKAADDPNATVDPEDIRAYERRHGRIPDGALVAMNSGWDALVDDGDAFRGGDGFPDLNFPGFSIDATDFLLARRRIVGIGVDTMSLDPGNSQDFAVHFGFLPTNHYGIENLANLDAVPPEGARVVVGAIPWEDGSGGPCRVIALT